MPLKIMFWNIQSLGNTRSSKPDVLREICRHIENENADIVCIQEMRVSKFNAAAGIVAAINNRITVPYQYIICPHNTFEMYLYLYRGSLNLQAAVLGANDPWYVDDTDLPTQNYTLTQGSTTGAYGITGLNNYFPLFDYKDRRTGRAPGAGLFRYADPTGIIHWLTIFNWHNDACNRKYLKGNVDRLGDSPLIDAGTFTAAVNGVNRVFDSFIIGGDFNYNMANEYPNYVTQIPVRTHLFTFDKDNDSKFNTALSIRDRSFDNIMTWLNGNLNVSNQAVVDLADYYMNNKNITTAALLNSDLITQTLDVQFARDRLITRFSLPKKKKQVSKKTMLDFKGIISKENLYQTRTGTMTRKIQAMQQVPPKQREILTSIATEFLTKELVTNNRWNLRLGDMNNLNYNDTLFLVRNWISDHLPVVATLNP